MEKESIKLKILEEIEKTKKAILDYREITKPVAPDVAIGRISRMDAINNNSVTASALRQAEEKLEKLNFVLSRIDSKEFGVCVKCNQEIPLGRIMIRPESIYCVKCAK